MLRREAGSALPNVRGQSFKPIRTGFSFLPSDEPGTRPLSDRAGLTQYRAAKLWDKNSQEITMTTISRNVQQRVGCKGGAREMRR